MLKAIAAAHQRVTQDVLSELQQTHHHLHQTCDVLRRLFELLCTSVAPVHDLTNRALKQASCSIAASSNAAR